MKTNNITPAGDLVIVTRGEYSDYGHMGHYRANELLDWKERLTEYLKTRPDEQEPYSANMDGFIEWLVATNLVTKIQVQEIYLGSYATWNHELYDEAKVRTFPNP